VTTRRLMLRLAGLVAVVGLCALGEGAELPLPAAIAAVVAISTDAVLRGGQKNGRS
jgi:hypothetical protein